VHYSAGGKGKFPKHMGQTWKGKGSNWGSVKKFARHGKFGGKLEERGNQMAGQLQYGGGLRGGTGTDVYQKRS